MDKAFSNSHGPYNIRLQGQTCHLNYRLQMQKHEPLTILASRKLFQQFIVDEYCMIESERLNYIRTRQKELRVESYCNLHEGNTDVDDEGIRRGKRIIIPSSFVGSRRYMDQLYFDGMAICATAGYLDIFICRVFKIKLELLMNDLKKNRFFGKVIEVYIIICVDIPDPQEDQLLNQLVKKSYDPWSI
ncbi:hypothetical protein L6164_001329 [Bauhinia variegata]|uniref:Uncharacterized protein n=1 Tax=Bauhinia variegata TaxID=167791 RepID=A0ACB9QBE1_BAUVA|nr:hypothetical protein L6164_001329 [Bauhinia variegata]